MQQCMSMCLMTSVEMAVAFYQGIVERVLPSEPKTGWAGLRNLSFLLTETDRSKSCDGLRFKLNKVTISSDPAIIHEH